MVRGGRKRYGQFLQTDTRAFPPCHAYPTSLPPPGTNCTRFLIAPHHPTHICPGFEGVGGANFTRFLSVATTTNPSSAEQRGLYFVTRPIPEREKRSRTRSQVVVKNQVPAIHNHSSPFMWATTFFSHNTNVRIYNNDNTLDVLDLGEIQT